MLGNLGRNLGPKGKLVGETKIAESRCHLAQITVLINSWHGATGSFIGSLYEFPRMHPAALSNFGGSHVRLHCSGPVIVAA